MVDGTLILDHFVALVLVWAWTMAGGAMWLRALPKALSGRNTIASALMIGVAFWSVVPFVFPFVGGIYVAAFIALVGMIFATTWGNIPSCWIIRGRRRQQSALILCVGCGSFLTPLATQYVAPGMDASMHTTSARLIADHADIPHTYAPFAPEIPFPPINTGAPTLAALAVVCGSPPESAMLAVEQLCYAAAILSMNIVLRSYVGRVPAALLAVASAWTGRGLQDTFNWGGFPTVLSLALGLFSVRLLHEALRRWQMRQALPLGLCVAALPAVHGIGAVIWLYLAPIAALAAWTTSRQRRGGVIVVGSAGIFALLILVAYLAFSQPNIGAKAIEWTKEAQRQWGPKGGDWSYVARTPSYIVNGGGDVIVIGGIAAWLLLLFRSRRSALFLAGAGLVLVAVVVNCRLWVLPASMMLYPDRATYWAVPIAAIAMALAWRSLPSSWRSKTLVASAAALALILVSASRHYHLFQRKALHPAITRECWDALQWARVNLPPSTTLVAADYRLASGYLPGVAGVATTGWHVHHFICVVDNKPDMFEARPVSHRLTYTTDSKSPPGSATPVFDNGAVRIVPTATIATRPRPAPQ